MWGLSGTSQRTSQRSLALRLWADKWVYFFLFAHWWSGFGTTLVGGLDGCEISMGD